MLVFDQLKKADRQLQLLAMAVLAGMIVLAAGLWYVQVVAHKHYRAELLDQSMRTVPIPAIRGKILDRNGFALAENRPRYNVNLYLEDLSKQFRREYSAFERQFRKEHQRKPNPQESSTIERQIRFSVAHGLAMRVSDALRAPPSLDEAGFHRHFAEQRALPIALMEDLQPVHIASFVEHASSFPAVDLEVEPLRHYPLKSLAAHVLGHLRRDRASEDSEEDASFDYEVSEFHGETGLEAAFESELRGKRGIKSILVNNLLYRHSETIWTEPDPGRNLVLTIDVPIQKATEKALNDAGAEARGAAVVMDVTNGDILAMASVPDFDPNDFVGRITPEKWATLSDKKLIPLFNRAANGAYPPGSILKILIGLACLDGGLEPDALLTVIPNPAEPGKGCYYVGTRKVKDTAPPGDYNFLRAFKLSSNSYFVHHGLRAGLERIIQWGRLFHLGERSGIITKQEVSGYFPVPGQREKRDGTSWQDGDTANLCIGQGEVTVTPLQMAVMTAAVANGGRVLTPRLVQRIESQDPNSLGAPEVFSPQVRERLNIKPATLKIMHDAMLADVEDSDGTGVAARVDGFKMGGKTGTAQVRRPGGWTDHITWFVSFGPIDHPRYAVVVVIESGGSGGGTCGPIAKKIYQAIQKREQMPTRDSTVVQAFSPASGARQ